MLCQRLVWNVLPVRCIEVESQDPGPSSLVDVAYSKIRSSVVSGEFPPGHVLVEQQLASAIGMSRTPVHRSLARLAADGLVQIVPRRGAVVAELTSRSLVEIFQFREALEVFGIREGSEGLDLLRLERLRAIFAAAIDCAPDGPGPLFSSVLSAADDELHYGFVHSLSNALIEKNYERLRLRLLHIRLRSWAATPPGKPHRGITVAAEEHCKIIEALLNKDRESAAEALSAHIRNGCEHMLAVTARDYPRRFGVPLDDGSSIVNSIVSDKGQSLADILAVIRETIESDRAARPNQ